MSKPDKQHKERPILFSAPMVRAILDGRKTQTRRVCKPIMAWEKQDVREARFWNGGWHEFFIGSDIPYAKLVCRHGRRGDRLWVRETWKSIRMHDHLSPRDIPVGADIQYPATYDGWDSKRRSPLHMPRWASRITLEITDIRVERLQDIRQDGAKAEGATPKLPRILGDDYIFRDDYTGGFIDLWKSINGAGSWDLNPFVWVIGFERVTP